MAAAASRACSPGVNAAVSSSKPAISGYEAGGASGGSSGSGEALSTASVARRARSASPSASSRLPTAIPIRPSRTTVSSIEVLSMSVGWWTSLPAKRARPERSERTTTAASSPETASSARSATSRAELRMDADLDVPEPGRRCPVGDVGVLPRLALAAVRKPVQAPGLGSGHGVERAPEERSDARVRGVAQHASQPAVPDLPGDLRSELEVEPLVVDRPALVGLQVDPFVDVCEQLLEGAPAGLEVKVRHPHERHAAPPVRPHRASAARAEPGRGLARGEEAAENAFDHDRLALRRNSLVVPAERADPAGRGGICRDVHERRAVAEGVEVVRLEEARARVGRFGSIDTVELDRVADRLVHLELRLLCIDHDGGDPLRAGLCLEQRRRLLAHTGRLPLERETLDILPARLGARADVRARVAADLVQAIPHGDRVDSSAALDQLLLDLGTVGGHEQLELALCSHRRLPDGDARVLERLLGAQTKLDLLRGRDVERVADDLRPVAALLGLGRQSD